MLELEVEHVGSNKSHRKAYLQGKFEVIRIDAMGWNGNERMLTSFLFDF